MIEVFEQPITVTTGYPAERAGRDNRTINDPKELSGYWWENDSIRQHNHLVMENGKDFHLMTAEEYYNADC